MKNEKKIAFLVRKSDEVRCVAALEPLQALRLPTGYAAELFTLAAEEPYAAQRMFRRKKGTEICASGGGRSENAGRCASLRRRFLRHIMPI